MQPSWYVRTQAVLWAPIFALQCCGRHQLSYQTNTVRLPPHASRHQQCCGRRHLPYQANIVKPPTYLWASTVWQAPTSAIPEEDDATSHMHLTTTVLWEPTIILYPMVWATRLSSIRTLSLSFACKAVPFIYKRGCALSQ